MNKSRNSVKKAQLPWERGPIAWKIARQSNRIRRELEANHRGYYSLRRASRLLDVSTQPLRDWTRLGFIKRHGPRKLYAREELLRFLDWLAHGVKKARGAERNGH